jgi:hypothetical protein
MTTSTTTDLFRLVYRSRCAVEGSADNVQLTVDAIIADSQRRNVRIGVTGALMFTGLFFVQALEGPTAAVEATFDRICCDLRHTSVEVIECGPIIEAVFGKAAMRQLVLDTDTGALLNHFNKDTELINTAAATMKLMAALVRSDPHLANSLY